MTTYPDRPLLQRVLDGLRSFDGRYPAAVGDERAAVPAAAGLDIPQNHEPDWPSASEVTLPLGDPWSVGPHTGAGGAAFPLAASSAPPSWPPVAPTPAAPPPEFAERLRDWTWCALGSGDTLVVVGEHLGQAAAVDSLYLAPDGYSGTLVRRNADGVLIEDQAGPLAYLVALLADDDE